MVSEPTRAEIDALAGPAVVEFGASWCPHCIGAQPLIAAAFANHAAVRHIKIEDGSGKPLGRSFGVKLWPTLIFLKGGKETGRLVRPANSNIISQQLELIDPGLAPG
jgi:thioredoxin 1